ncbi:hypothetical protein [Octadecabacter ascidiaceicola]|uniref:PilZ domain-containing protein n=1 Tax=Octadecabacter ascidiaceicola TaxID=1655543 RepID=A0A238KME1_9RHOB|nr:hypothetical protein [Octadecabacter ascidiaceicola]SMX43272.1 hypothetical protein OCA8868_02915 [Octadecabacter ascidiaceicola]
MISTAVRLLAFVMLMVPLASRADTNALCGNVIALNALHSEAVGSNVVPGSAQIASILDAILLDLEGRTNRLPLRPIEGQVVELRGHSVHFSTLSARNSGSRVGTNELSQVMTSLSSVSALFGCTEVQEVEQIAEPIGPIDLSTKPFLHSLMEFVTKTNPTGANLFLFVLAIALAALAGRFVMIRLRKDNRKMCRTFVLCDFSGACTISHIVDINRRGIKIEAPKEDVSNEFCSFYFAGIEQPGRIVWRNKYFAGVRFKKRISAADLQKVLDASQQPIETSGLRDKATPCYSDGCHLNCPRHKETALDLDQSEAQPAT